MSEDTTEDESWARHTSSIAATLTTEAELKAWYIATNPTLRNLNLSCPATLYREMQRDLRDFNATVAIMPDIAIPCGCRLYGLRL